MQLLLFLLILKLVGREYIVGFFYKNRFAAPTKLVFVKNPPKML